MLFSVLIAQYNNGRFFKDCYESILSQSYQNYEIIIVDDCSTDNSLDIIKEITKDDQHVKIYLNDLNRGCGYTKARCASLAAGDVMGYVDPDDTLSVDALKIMIEKHGENPNVGLIYSNAFFCDENLKIEYERKGLQEKNGDNMFFNMNNKIDHFAAFKRSIYKETQGIDPYLQRAVDQDLYLKLYEKADVLYIDATLYNYRVHNAGISKGSNVTKALYWHWVVIIDAAKRRNVNVEDLLVGQFYAKSEMKKIVHNAQVFENDYAHPLRSTIKYLIIFFKKIIKL